MLGHLSSDPTSMQSVRQTLEADANPGVEGASNLFYYLFDDWRAVYSTIAAFRVRLESLVCVCRIQTIALADLDLQQKDIIEDMVSHSLHKGHSVALLRE